MANANITAATVADEAGDIVEQRFSGFLNEYIDPSLIDTEDRLGKVSANGAEPPPPHEDIINVHKNNFINDNLFI